MSGMAAKKKEDTVSVGSNAESREYVHIDDRRPMVWHPGSHGSGRPWPPPVAKIPMADPVIAGSINLRGRIVTVIDMRKRLRLPPRENDVPGMNIVVEHNGNLYSLLIDAVGEVMEVPDDKYEKNPATVDPLWRDFSEGVYRLENQLLIVLNVEKLPRNG